MKAIQGQQINGDLHQIRKQLSLLIKLHGKTFPLTYNVIIISEYEGLKLTMQATIRNYSVNRQKVKAKMHRDSITLTPSSFYLLFFSGT